MKKIFLILPILLLLNGCYSFRGLTVDCAVTKNFSITPFINNASSAPPTVNETFMELLRDKVLSETCLSSTSADGDVQFSGEVFKYQVTAVAPTDDETNLINRLTIGISVDYINTANEKDNVKKRYEWFEEFDSGEDLLSIQDELIISISDQILEKVFNDAFTNW
jgi:hypothetical protein